MKKTAIGLIFSVLSCGTALAQNPSWCGYKDRFRISSAAHPGIYISQSSADGDVLIHVMSPRSFIIRDTPKCATGYAHVTLLFDNENWCVLDIKDGPWMLNPKVEASCHGLQYLGTESDGWGSHAYTIKVQ